MWALEKILGSPAPRSAAAPRGISPTPEERKQLAEQLMLAATSGDVHEARQLLATGAQASCRGEFGATPLHRAAEQGHTTLASLLLAHGADVNERDEAGDTPLLCACRMGRAKVARVLLAAGGDATLCNKQGSNSLDAALEAREMLGLAEVSELLLKLEREGAAVGTAASGPASAAAGSGFSALAGGRGNSSPAISGGSQSRAGVSPVLDGKESSTPHPSRPALAFPAAGGGAAGTSSTGVGGAGGPGSGGAGGIGVIAGGGGASAPPPVMMAGSTRLRLRREEWALDRNYPNCHLCKEQFTIFNRRHHCRSCGLVFCEKCSSSSVSLATTSEGRSGAAGAPSIVRVRVCLTCAQLHAATPDGPLVVDRRGPIETREVAANLVETARSLLAPAFRQAGRAISESVSAVRFEAAVNGPVPLQPPNPHSHQRSLSSLSSSTFPPYPPTPQAASPSQQQPCDGVDLIAGGDGAPTSMAAADLRGTTPDEKHAIKEIGTGGGRYICSAPPPLALPAEAESPTSLVRNAAMPVGEAAAVAVLEPIAADGHGGVFPAVANRQLSGKDAEALRPGEVHEGKGSGALRRQHSGSCGDLTRCVHESPIGTQSLKHRRSHSASFNTSSRGGGRCGRGSANAVTAGSDIGGLKGGGSGNSGAAFLKPHATSAASTPAAGHSAPSTPYPVGVPRPPSQRRARLNTDASSPAIAASHVPLPSSTVRADEPSEVEHRRRLMLWIDTQLRMAVQRQVEKEAPDLLSWHPIIEALARRAAESLRPEPNRSINALLKIKTLPGGKPHDARYVDGVVCRLRLADKRMKSKLESPRILLLDCPLEHESGSLTTSLESLRQQEEEHMEMVVSELARLKIDLLLVGGSVCLTAKEKLLQAGIALVVQVKATILRRLARVCGTSVYRSPAQLLGASPGTCGQWCVETTTISELPMPPPAPLPTVVEVTPSSPAPPTVLGSSATLRLPPSVTSASACTSTHTSFSTPPATTKRVTLMCFEQCDPAAGATVVLRGEPINQLKILKHLLAAAAFVASDLITEAACVYDFGGTMPGAPSAPSPRPRLFTAGHPIMPHRVSVESVLGRQAARGYASSFLQAYSPPLAVGASAGAVHASASPQTGNSLLSPASGTVCPSSTTTSTIPLVRNSSGAPSEGQASRSASTVPSRVCSAAGSGSKTPMICATSAMPLVGAGLSAATGSGPAPIMQHVGALGVPPASRNTSYASTYESGTDVTSTAACRSSLATGSGVAERSMGAVRDPSLLVAGEDEYFLAAIPDDTGGNGRIAGVPLACGVNNSLVGAKTVKCLAGASKAGVDRLQGGYDRSLAGADRLWDEEARQLRVSSCWKRWDVSEAPCQVPRDRTLPFNIDVPAAASVPPEDCRTLGQFLISNCFNPDATKRPCNSARCRESVLRHEFCFSFHGARISLRVMQLAESHALPDRLVGWSICRACEREGKPAMPTPRALLSDFCVDMSLGRFLELSAYNDAARSRFSECDHSLHFDHERFVGTGLMVCSIRHSACVVFGVIPPGQQLCAPHPNLATATTAVRSPSPLPSAGLATAPPHALLPQPTPHVEIVAEASQSGFKEDAQSYQGVAVAEASDSAHGGMVVAKQVEYTTPRASKVGDGHRGTKGGACRPTTCAEYSAPVTPSVASAASSTLEPDAAVHSEMIAGSSESTATREIDVTPGGGGAGATSANAPAPLLNWFGLPTAAALQAPTTPVAGDTADGTVTEMPQGPADTAGAPGASTGTTDGGVGLSAPPPTVLAAANMGGTSATPQHTNIASPTAVASGGTYTKGGSSSAVAALALESAAARSEVERAAGGCDIASITGPGADARLGEMMCAPDALSKLEVRYDPDASDEAELSRHCGGLHPGKVTILFPAAFAALRQRFCHGGDAAFINSLRNAQQWDAGLGGRSGSTFLKTSDERYLLKGVPKSEYQSFYEHAQAYFAFVRMTPNTLPSVLVKVLGAFHVEFRSADKKTAYSHFLLVQENLFYGQNVFRLCDLKGAHRNRAGEDEKDTIVDENLFQLNDGYPLLLSERAKQQLTRALWNDTLFLSSINVMDYSLLVGIIHKPRFPDTQDRPQPTQAPGPTISSSPPCQVSAALDSSSTTPGSANCTGPSLPNATAASVPDGSLASLVSSAGDWTLVVGLIDYCRQYTWKEEAESRMKRSTVIPPKQYKRRFREALNRYFMCSMEKYDE